MLSRCDLSESDFSNAVVEECEFFEANLEGATLKRVR